VLLELHVKDLALVEDIWLEFGSGLTVLTGETGAGKTVLVGALQLLLGDRADTSLVRSGAEEALVEGRFLIGDEERLVRRRITAEGRSRCSIDGEMATVGALGELLDGVVDLHGQHEHQALLSVGRHAGYLDRFIGEAALSALEVYRAALDDVRIARATLEELERSLSDRDRRIEYLRFQVSDIDAVGPRAGEDTEVESRLPRLRHAEKLIGAAGTAWMSLRDESGAADALAEASAALAQVSDLDPVLDGVAAELAECGVALEDIGSRLRIYSESIEHDPQALDEAESRLATLAALRRKYGNTLEDIIELRARAMSELDMLEAGEAGLETARAAAARAEDVVRAAGERLVSIRLGATAAFASRLAEAARDLALPSARFEVEMKDLPREVWSADGPQRVEFLFATSAGETLRPLAKIASGGEISRVMLALKDVLGQADHTPVLVFDEVDAGIGGATALAVARRLASLARAHQVLVVTHLAQVAAFAQGHVVVEKAESDGRSVTVARAVLDDERVGEVARMLSGGATRVGLDHARELLDMAAGDKETRVV
jgi:DNA repair protein RecN (Recombination protein N)